MPHARVLVVSSAEVYGAVPLARQPIRETETGASSLALRDVEGRRRTCRSGERTRLNRCKIISSHLAGPGRTIRDSFIRGPDRTHRARAAGACVARGNLDAIRDLGDVRDTVDAYRRLIETSTLNGVVNVATGHGVQVRAVLKMLLDMSAEPIRIEEIPPACAPATSRHSSAMPISCRASPDGCQADPSNRPSAMSSPSTVVRARMAEPRRALITGITGQDGSYLADFLLERGYEVFGVVRRASTESFERIAHLTTAVQLLQADLLDQASLQQALRDARPHEVYNLAAQSFVPTSWSQPVLTARVHGSRRHTHSRSGAAR